MLEASSSRGEAEGARTTGHSTAMEEDSTTTAGPARVRSKLMSY